jgi:hypoxanthine phosphoribosyltransferase
MNSMHAAARSTIHDDVEEILLTEEQISERVAELGSQLEADYAGRDPVLVSVLKGSIIFLADLIRAMQSSLSLDLMEVSSYGASTESSGQVRILKDLSKPIEGRDVIVVEDIIDTGLTLNYLLKYLHDKGPASVRICCLLDKPARRLAEIPIDYRGFTIPDRFVVGYGLDYDERYRNLPYIGVLKPSVYGAAPPEG